MPKHSYYDKLQKILQDRRFTVRVFEPSVNVEIQAEYFKISLAVKKDIDWDNDYLLQVSHLYDPLVTVDDKKILLCTLASFDNVDYFQFLEQFEKMAPDELKDWATLALYESRMCIESGFLNSSIVLVSTGLGAKNYSLRYFVVLIANSNEGFSGFQYDFVKNETEFAFRKYGGEVEEISTEGPFVKFVCLLPIQQHIGKTILSIIDQCNTFGNFIKRDFILTNTHRLSTEEIENFLNSSDK